MKYSQLQDKLIGIYKINFPNGKSYIGLSNNIKRRISEHFRDGRKDLPCHRAIIKYFDKLEDMDVEVLETIEEEDYLILSELEKKWISYFDTSNKEKGYNLTEGGLALLNTKNPFSKFSEQDLNVIYNLLLDGHSNVFIASQFNVHPDTIGRINNGSRYYNPNYTYPIRTQVAKERSGFNSEKAISPIQFEKIVKLLKETKLTCKQIGEEVGVHSSTINRINQGKISYCPKEWTYPIRINSQNKTRLSQQDILNIHELLRKGYSIISIAKKYDCSRDTISDINSGLRHYVEGVSYPIKS